MTDQIYTEVLKVWNDETPDDFAIFSEFYYQMFGGEFEIPYITPVSYTHLTLPTKA